MFFITLGKWKQVPKKETMDQTTKKLEELKKQGIDIRVHWTLGRYDIVAFTEAPSEKDVMKALLNFQNLVDTETMTAVPREEAVKLL